MYTLGLIAAVAALVLPVAALTAPFTEATQKQRVADLARDRAVWPTADLLDNFSSAVAVVPPSYAARERVYVVRGDRWNPFTNETRSEWPAAYRSAAPEAEGKWEKLLGDGVQAESVRWIPLAQPTFAADFNETAVLRGYPLTKDRKVVEVNRFGRANVNDTLPAARVITKARTATALEAAIDWASVSFSTTSYSASTTPSTYILDNKSDLYSIDAMAVYKTSWGDGAPSGEYDRQFVLVYGGTANVSAPASSPLQPLTMESITIYPRWAPPRQITTVPKLTTTSPPVLTLYHGGGTFKSGTSLVVFSSPAPMPATAASGNSSTAPLLFMMLLR
ncbi:hypothetical protein H9P43_002439 [Blastocladiella emersonii ATCC 22665]|nr:hypothetical protein H9P43_002439 [Blastocladiella emersonii ATCC 22665]